MTVTNLVDTMWMVRYPWPVEITYDQGGEFLGRKFKIILIENEYVIKTKHGYLKNPQSNVIIKIIHKVLGNLVHPYNLKETYVDDADL